MLDDLLRFGSTFDWISPLFAIIQDHVNGPAHTFLVPDDCGWSGLMVKRLLQEHGIKPWGLMIVDHYITLTVRLAQAGWAQTLLEQKGIPFECPVPGKQKAQAANQMRSASCPRRRDWLDGWLDDFFDWLEQ